MVDQYIYTRTEAAGRGISQGFACRTEGIVGGVQNGVLRLTGREEAQADGQGGSLPVWMKVALEERKDKIVFQRVIKERWAEGDTTLYHGFVTDPGDPIFAQPEQWSGLPFCPGQGEIPQKLTAQAAATVCRVQPQPLAAVLSFFQLHTADFIRLVRGCFEAKQNRELVVVAVDYSRPNALEMAQQLLMWLFRFLPMAMRRSVDFTTCISEAWSGRCAVGLVANDCVSAQSGKMSLRLEHGGITSGSLLFAEGRMAHTTRRMTRGSAPGGLFIQWLDSLAAWVEKQPPQQGERVMAALNRVYLRFDAMIASLPEGDRCKLNYYDALCWNHLMVAGDEMARRVPARSDLTCFEDLLAFGSWPEVLGSVGKMLDGLESLYTSPASAQLIRLMTKIVRLDGVDENLGRAREMLCAFLSKDMELAEIGESSAVSAKYLQLMASGGMPAGEALEYLEHAFFPDTIHGGGERWRNEIWKRAGTSWLPSEGYRRCSDWVGGYVNLCLTGEELIQCADTILRELDGFRPEALSRVLDCLLGAQEARCYYAKLEILPVHLTACCRCISQVRTQVPEAYWEVAERYYTKLFVQLCREYLAYWAGRHTLTGICQLMTEFRREGWRSSEDSLLKELIVAQCNGICEYDWETLKAQMSQEGPEILERLWQILDQLEAFWLEDDLGDRLCSQVCRYLLHGMPDYVDDGWLCSQVQRRRNLKRSGYYLELLTMYGFLRGQEQTMALLQQWIRRYRMPPNSVQDMMKFFYRLFRRGDLHQVEVVAVQCAYATAGQRLKVDQLEVLHTVCQVRGGDALIELLGHWPSAAAESSLAGRKLRRVEAKRRKGSYAWLKTDQDFLGTLETLSKERDGLIQTAAGTENFYLRLMEEINQLVPVGTQGRSQAVEINRRLLALWESESGFAARVLGGSRKRALLAE